MNDAFVYARLRVLLAMALSVLLAWPLHARAEPETDAVAEAQRLYEEGRARFDTLDYGGAVDLWTRAYAKLPATDDNRETRNLLAYNIATAQEKAFELDGNVTHLKQARGLLDRYLQEYKTLYQPTPANREEAKRVEARIAELDARIAQAEGAGPRVDAATGGPSNAAASNRAAERDKKRRTNEILASDPELGTRYRKGKSMMITGAVLLGAGAAFLGLALIYATDAAAGDGTAAVISGVSATVSLGLLIPGAVLLPIGLKRFKSARREAEQRASLTVVPGRDRWTIGFGMRF